MKTTIKFMTSVMIAFSLLFINTSCEGGDGTNGVDGQDGNANVVASDWFTPNPYLLSPESGGNDFLQHDIAVPEITKEILDNGVVLVYGRLESYAPSIWPTDQVTLMPITVKYGDGIINNVDIWSANLSLGNIQIQVINDNNDYSFLPIDPKFNFRYVIIPSSKMIEKSAIDYSDYEMVKETYNL